MVPTTNFYRATGDADGLGEVRKKELIKSGLQLGIGSKDDILVVEDKYVLHALHGHQQLLTEPRNFPDSMTVTWHPRLISNLLTTAFAPNMASISSKEAPQATVDTIITFDAHGVSNHPNHKSLHDGAHTFLKALMHRHSGWECPIKLYTLTTTSIFRKYLSLLDAPATLIGAITRKKELGSFPTPLLFVSSPVGYRTAQKAMTTAHESQMRWFRWGWITLSRYMVLNDLKKEKAL
jgi:N-acetylglucosaminylphosphatidylinositol deacetylase